MSTWSDKLGIRSPTLESVMGHREANTYSLLLVALLERGQPMTLEEVATRFADVGFATFHDALVGLKRCRPARPPVYRDGDQYSLDPHDDELDLWAFRLGLRPAKVPMLSIVQPPAQPPRGPDVPLSLDELRRAWTNASLYNWSIQRIVLAVLDAHQEPMGPEQIAAFVAGLVELHGLRGLAARPPKRVIEILADGRWAIVPGSDEALASARGAVRARLETALVRDAEHLQPAVVEANRKSFERQRLALREELARLRRAIVIAVPASSPRAVAIVDDATRSIETFLEGEVAQVGKRLAQFDLLAAIEVRPLVRTLGLDPDRFRLSELGPAQKSMRVGARGRTLRVTADMLVKGTCGRALADGDAILRLLERHRESEVRTKLVADAKTLHAFHHYGRLHGRVRLRAGAVDEIVDAPWSHMDEVKLHDLLNEALESHRMLEVVLGPAPDWDDPFAHAILAIAVRHGAYGAHILVRFDDGFVIDPMDVQCARLEPVV